MTTTPLLRWRVADPRGSVKAYEVGDAGQWGGLVRIDYMGRRDDEGWVARVRAEPDANFGDGWMWTNVIVRDENALGGYAEVRGSSEREIKAYVRECWDEIERFARPMLDAGNRELAERAAKAAEPTSVPAAAEDAVAVEEDALAALQADAEGSAPARPVSDDVAAALAERYAEAVAGIAAGLRRAAERVERWGEPHESLRDLKPDHTRAAGQVISEVTGAVGNLSLSRLVEAARDADNAVRGRKT